MADLQRCGLCLYTQKSHRIIRFHLGSLYLCIYVEGILANNFRNASIGLGTENHDILNSSFYKNVDRMSTKKAWH